MPLSLKWLVLLMVVCLLGLAVAFPQPKRMPVQPGTAEEFWNAAAGVRKNVIPSGSWCFAQPVNGVFLYSEDGWHGSSFFEVPEADVLAHFPKSVDELGGEDMRVLGWAGPAYRKWQETDPQGGDPQLLLLCLREAQLEWWASKSVPSRNLVATADFYLGIAYQRMRLFPLVQLAEWSYLSALIVFAAWPWIKNRSPAPWAIRASVLPLLLFLPYYLGYCAWNFTSAGPGGGIIYPFILDAFRWLPWTRVDQTLIQHVPQILSPLTGPLGSMLSLSGSRHAGPVAALGLGVGLGTTVFFFGLVLRHRGLFMSKHSEAPI
jgi:hypothetical protein